MTKHPLIPRTRLFALLVLAVVHADDFNGFDLSAASIPRNEIHRGGPPRDGIPSIDHPRFVPPGEAGFLRRNDEVVSVTVAGKTRAYPLRILVWHEIVNDVLAGKPLAITYCPLCASSMVFDRRIGGKVRTFGVSGLLYQSDVLLYDRETESLWTQLGRRAVSGPDRGKPLSWIASETMTWEAWRKRHPDGEVLSTETGHRRNYAANAYADYFSSPRVMFPVTQYRDDLPNKELVVGLWLDGHAKAYRLADLKREGTIQDRVGQRSVTLVHTEADRHTRVTDDQGREIPYVGVYWFAWQAFYPSTQLWGK